MEFQLGSALLDACVLAVLAQEDCYGYSLTARIREVVTISESTLYPVLRRLQKEGLLTTYDQPYQGRNRRYYRITDEGRAQALAYQKQWRHFQKQINQILQGAEEDDC